MKNPAAEDCLRNSSTCPSPISVLHKRVTSSGLREINTVSSFNTAMLGWSAIALSGTVTHSVRVVLNPIQALIKVDVNLRRPVDAPQKTKITMTESYRYTVCGIYVHLIYP